MAAPVNPVTVGRIIGVHGVRGWVKVQSSTQPETNILEYRPWWICRKGEWRSLQVDHHRWVNKGLLCHLKGLDDRDEAKLICQQDIAVEKSCLAALDEGEHYWHELQGLAVLCHWQGRAVSLGRVADLLATGANDVLVVTGSKDSLDQRERLIPYVDHVIVNVDLENSLIEVDWDPDF